MNAQVPIAPSAAQLAAAFEKTFRAFEAQDDMPKIVGACWMRMLWQDFNAEFPDVVAFARADAKVRFGELEKDWTLLQQTKTAEAAGRVGHGAAFGARLLYCYKYALALNYPDLAIRILDALEPWNRVAAEFDQAVDAG